MKKYKILLISIIVLCIIPHISFPNEDIDINYKFAKLYFDKKNYYKALNYSKLLSNDLKEYHKDKLEYYSIIVKIYYKLGEFDEAIKILDIIPSDDKNGDLYFIECISNLGLFFYKNNDNALNKSIEIFKILDNKYSNNEFFANLKKYFNDIEKLKLIQNLISVYIINLYYTKNDNIEVLKSFSESDKNKFNISLGTIVLKLKEQGIKYYSYSSTTETENFYIDKSELVPFLEANPVKLMEYLEDYAEQIYYLNDFQKAQNILKILIKIDENNIWTRYLLGKTYFMLDDYKNAIDEFNDLEKIKDDFWGSHYYKALSLYSIYRLSEAERELLKTIELKKEHENAYYYLAAINYKLQSYKNAENYLNRLLKINYKNLNAILLLIDVYESAEKYDELDAFYKEKYPDFHNESDFVIKYARYLINNSQIDKGIKILEELIKKKENGEAYYILAKTYFDNEDFDKSLNYFIKADDIGYNTRTLHLRISTILFDKKAKYEEGLKYLKKAITSYSKIIKNDEKEIWDKDKIEYKDKLIKLLSKENQKNIVIPFQSNENLKSFVNSLVKGSSSKLEKVKRLFTALKTAKDKKLFGLDIHGLNVDYDLDYAYNSTRYEKSASKLFDEALENNIAKGICSEQSYLLYAMSKEAGLDCYFVEQDTGYITSDYYRGDHLKVAYIIDDIDSLNTKYLFIVDPTMNYCGDFSSNDKNKIISLIDVIAIYYSNQSNYLLKECKYDEGIIKSEIGIELTDHLSFYKLKLLMLYFSCNIIEYERFRDLIIDKLSKKKDLGLASTYDVNLTIKYLVEKNEFNEALKLADDLIKKNPNNYRFYDSKVQILYKLGKQDEVNSTIKKIITLLKTESYYYKDYSVEYSLIDYLTEINKLDDAISRTQKLLKDYPDEENLYTGLGDLYWYAYGDEVRWRSNYENAIKIIDIKMNKQKNNGDKYNYFLFKKADILSALGMYKEAIKLSSQFLTSCKTDPETFQLLFDCNYYLYNYENAKKYHTLLSSCIDSHSSLKVQYKWALYNGEYAKASLIVAKMLEKKSI